MVKINFNTYRIMDATFRENYSQQTKDTLILEYKYKVEALLNKIHLLESKLILKDAKLEILKNNNILT